jgi:hypothetical protein
VLQLAACTFVNTGPRFFHRADQIYCRAPV